MNFVPVISQRFMLFTLPPTIARRGPRQGDAANHRGLSLAGGGLTLPLMTRRTFVIVVFGATAMVMALRLFALADTEPRYDQAFFAWWVRLLVESNHFWPHGTGDIGFFQALKADSGSLLHQLFRNLYNKPTSVFTILPLGIISGLSALFGDSYRFQTIVSIVWATLLLPVLATYGMWGRGSDHSRPAVGLTAMILATINPTLFWFSPLGVHNFGIVGLTVALAATEARLGARIRGEQARHGRSLETAAHLIGCFSHWTNPFLLPAAALGAKFLATKGIGRRIRMLFDYIPTVAVLVLCLMPLIVVEINRPLEDRTHSLSTVAHLTNVANVTQLLQAGISGISLWFEMAAETFTLPGSILAQAGLALMWRRGVRSPALLAATHLALFAVMPGFAGASLRVFPYLIPILCIGFAETLAAIAAWRLVPALGVAALVLSLQIPSVLFLDQFRQARPHFSEFYYRGDGELRPMITEMDKMIPTEGVLLSWSYGLYVVHEALREGPPIPLSLDGLWLRYQQGDMGAYLKGRAPITARRVFLVTEDSEQAALSPPMAERLPALLGPEGLGLIRHPRLIPLAHWHLTTSSPGDTTLWEVVEDKENAGG